MKTKLLLSTIVLLLLVAFYAPVSSAAAATYTFNMTLKNDVSVSNTVYEFDVYMQMTGTGIYAGSYQLATSGISVKIDNSVVNGGTVTAIWIPGTTELTNASQLPSPLVVSVSGGTNLLIKAAAPTPPGAGNGSMISNVAPGTKFGRIRLTNSVPFNAAPGNLSWATALYPFSVNIYVGTTNTTVTTQRTLVVSLSNPVLPVELSSFSSTAQGRTVVLSWSTKTEKNSDRFDVQRSLVSDGNWSTVASVKASVLSNSQKDYSYTDTKLQSGKYQYRLNMIDNDGSSSLSTVQSAEVAVPKDFAVSQNYPNPFNPSTKIDYQVPVDAKVILEVYNIAGQKVVELVNRQQSAGYYTVDFGSTKLSSGVYIYRLAASDVATGNNFSSIKKMMLLK